jgi:hypothetical protein
MGTTSKNRKVYARHEQTAGRRRGKTFKTAQCANRNGGFGFLNHHFEPVWHSAPLGASATVIEQQFYKSVQYLSDLYGFKIRLAKDLPFPYNISSDFATVRNHLKKAAPSLGLIIGQDADKAPCLTSFKILNTGRTFYYVPVQPLYQLLQDKKRKQAAALLLSVCAYLYHVLEIPYHTKEGSFLYDEYATIEQCTEDGSYDDEDIAYYAEQLAAMKKESAFILRKLNSPVHLKQFERRLHHFKITCPKDKEILETAQLAFDLFRRYPHRSLFSAIPRKFLDPDAEERIYADQYISFFWKWGDDGFTHTLTEIINTEFQEILATDEPVAFQSFDTAQPEEQHDFSFATATLDMMEQLIDILMH